MEKAFEVRIVERHVMTYLVTAETADKAIDAAKNRYQNGDNGESTGSEWSVIDAITAEEVFGGRGVRQNA